jgi:hypothetical protein
MVALRRVCWGFGAVLIVLACWFVRAARGQVDAATLAVELPVPAAASAAAPVVDAAMSEATSPPTTTPHGGDEAELCGGVWVKLKDDGSADPDDLRRVARLTEAGQQVIDALRADAGEFARATAVWLDLSGSAADRAAMPGALDDCNGAECEASRQAMARFAEGRDTLARMAATTRDPQVYALAFNTCGPVQPGAGACQLLSAEQWARLDPDNATPWLFALDQAVRRRDAAAQNEALFRISTSKRSDLDYFALPASVVAHMPSDDASRPAALMLVGAVIGVEAAWTLPLQDLSTLCRGQAVRDANRRQICSAVADLLVDRADSFLERGVGIGMGRQLGGTAERVERLRAEQAAYTGTLGAFSITPLSGCADIGRVLAMLARHARLGEAGAMREWVARSGKEVDAFISADRDARDSRAAGPATMASAASAAN